MLADVFRTYDSFIESGLWSYFRAPGGSQDTSLSWMNDLPESQVLVLQFLASMLSGSPNINKQLDTCLASDFLIAAELAMAMPHWTEAGLFNLAQSVEMHSSAHRVPEAPMAETTATADAAPSSAQESPNESASKWLPDAGDVEQQQQTVQEQSVSEYFPHIVLSDIQCDMLKKVTPEKLEAVISHAKLRAARNVSLIIGEAFAADMTGMDAADSRVHMLLWDVKAAATNTSDVGLSKPWKFAPPHDANSSKALTKVMKQWFGRSCEDVDGADRLMRKQDIAMFMDGRVPTIRTDITKQLRTSLKNLPPQFIPSRPTVNFEFFYHNNEWSLEQALPGRNSRTRFHACMPSHTEQGIAVIGKDFAVDTRERRWVNTPGSNRQRGWSDNSLQREADHCYITRATLQALHPDKVVSDAMCEDAESDDGECQTVDKVLLCPWQVGEDFWKELFNSVADCKQLVIFSPTPAGPACLAAARLGASFVGWVRNAMWKSVLMEYVVLHIALDLVCGNREDRF